MLKMGEIAAKAVAPPGLTTAAIQQDRQKAWSDRDIAQSPFGTGWSDAWLSGKWGIAWNQHPLAIWAQNNLGKQAASDPQPLPLKEDFIVLVPELGDAELLLNFDAEDGVNNGDGIEISMHECENIAGFRPGRKIRTGRLQLDAGSDQWVPISLDSMELLETSEHLQEADSLEDASADLAARGKAKSPGRSYIIILHAAEHVSLRCSEKSFTGFTGRFQGRKQLFNPCFRVLAGEGKPGNRVPRAVQTNRVNAGSICASSNLNNGYNRPYGSPNIWMSDACSSAWIECEWPELTTIEEIRLYFNPDLSSERVNLKGESFSDHHGMFLKEQMPPELVRGYTISIDHDGKWEKTVGISNNIKRMAVHKLNKPYTTRKIRIDLTETWGSENYELFEIRVY